MKKRSLYYQLQKQLAHKNALVITGMRQVGKTTLMQQLFAELGDQPKLWYDFDNPLDQKLFEEEQYNNIYRRLMDQVNTGTTKAHQQRLYVFLDEIQNLPPVTKVIKYLIDHYGVKFVVTGSSSFYLKNLFPESLSGRKFLYVLPPLSFQEYLYFTDRIDLSTLTAKQDLGKEVARSDVFLHKRYEPDYERYLHYGGFPEVVTTQDIATKTLILRNIFASFFEKDLGLLSDYADIRQLRDLILLLVPRVGSRLEVSKLAAELSIDRPKLYGFLEFLQGTFMISLLPKFSHSIDRAVAGGKKVYFNDTGLLTAIGTINDGQLFENAVHNQLSAYGELSFYDKKHTAEIDFILDKHIAFEAKLKGSDRDVQKLQRLATDLRINKSYVIARFYAEQDGMVSPVTL